MRLIVNADDFGMCKGVNYGIIDAFVNGIITSTTLMVTMPFCQHALQLWEMHPALPVGLHLNITLGKPLTNCHSLVDAEGAFYKPKMKPDLSHFREDEIYLEFKAQYDLFIEMSGKRPTHFDSHLFSHQVYPVAQAAAIRLAAEVNLPLRAYKVNGFPVAKFINWAKTDFSGSNEEKIIHVLASLGEEVSELMVHPGFLDDFLLNSSSYSFPRLEELKILTSERIKEAIVQHNIELISFRDLGE